MNKLEALLTKLHACEEAIEWARSKKAATAVRRMLQVLVGEYRA